MRTPRPRNNAAVYEDAIMEAEITRMLLLVHIQPIPTNPDKSYVEMLYAYENDAQPVRDMDLVLYTTLQDVWIARTEGDLQLLLELQGELYMKLTTQQNDILQLIIHGVRHQ
ncbi:hypothetical protein SARC_01861 [Sphaeroforma arctica JP610]|uniref:Uncharacterized protein n=1 Tax=Sphaeroforma arctica JP610 TaxID=667725 RepID=A0A0L0GAG9_9EUKA|nr:hypothetical protein SARC_01861 [Sphaeroforma arctica JP610]KNC85985.1 hypothetical protein SARC_01861 [Sphaeroforma arctica JP610]|eukprot:XP_014159887.1 hypothetical protein SARC_01861 [Sphaeroforma arctica JP610]